MSYVTFTPKDEDVREFLQSAELDPRTQSFFAAEAVASRYGLPIYEAQRIIRSL